MNLAQENIYTLTILGAIIFVFVLVLILTANDEKIGKWIENIINKFK